MYSSCFTLDGDDKQAQIAITKNSYGYYEID